MIYRRIKNEAGIVHEGIEIVPVDSLTENISSLNSFNSDSIKVQYSGDEVLRLLDAIGLLKEMEFLKGSISYSVELPEFLQVKPQDLRRLAYDHKKVRYLVTICVIDNTRDCVFLPSNDPEYKDVQHRLHLALQDLSSVMDLKSVECGLLQPDEDKFSVRVSFEHKNGETSNLVIEVSE